MADLKLGNVSVQMKLVADIQRKGEGARIVPNKGPDSPPPPRVDIQTEVETYDKRAGTTTSSSAQHIARHTGGPVNVGAGGGVLGHLLKHSAAAAVPDPDKLSTADLKALLEPFLGQRIVVTSYDRDEASTLAEATKKHSVGDNAGVLRGVSDEGLILEKDGKKDTLRTEYWAMARIRLADGDQRVVAQDPTYPKLYVD